METLIEFLPLLMFATLAVLLFTGYPVAFVLGGVALAFAGIGLIFSEELSFNMVNLFTIVSRISGSVAENLILVAIPMFIFMGTMLERSGVAKDLLYCLEVLLRRVPGGLALAVTLMGTIMAATTGIIGASVVMMTLLALPVMMRSNYNMPLATGTIAASGTLGILIPPSIMLVIMADLLSKSVGNLFFAAFFPGLILAGLYMVYIVVRCSLNPSLAPPLPDHIGPKSKRGLLTLIFVAFVPPVLLIVLVLGSILFGWASPTEAAAVGAFGAMFLALIFKPFMVALFGDISNRDADDTQKPRKEGTFGTRFRQEAGKFPAVLKDVTERSALTGGMLFMIFLGATAFSYMFGMLNGDELVTDFIENSEMGSWGILFALLALVFALGFFFDWLEITLIVLPIFEPIISELDFGDHVAKKDVVYWFAILIAVNLQTSFLTPPFGFALFYMKGSAPPEVKIRDIYVGIIPFVMLQLIGLGLVMAFPGIAMWLPNTYLN